MASLSLLFNILAVDNASSVLRNIGTASTAGGRAVSAGIGLAGLALGKFGTDAIQAGADFDATIRQVGAIAGVPAPKLKELSKLALKFGADTKFSAGEAASAILELAKGGLTTAEIKAGALSSTLTLAAAGGVDLGEASTVVSNSLSTFGLKAKDAGQVAAALAGGANASTASVSSLGQALSQVGPGAASAGLSIQTTVAALAAFDKAGIKGSDAGTSLKTFLTRLVPTTDAAAAGFKTLGLSTTDASGKFRPLGEIAQQLKVGLAGLSDEQKTLALNQAFGADASRAAIVLAKEGEAGLAKLTTATSDQAAAQRIAAAATQGTKGALEQLGGSFETLQIQAGLALGPLVEKAALLGVAFLNGVVPALTQARTAVGEFLTPLLPAFNSLVDTLSARLQPALDLLNVAFSAVVAAVRDNLQPILTVLGGQLGGLLLGAVVALGAALGGALLSAIGAVAGVLLSPIALFGALAGALVVAYQRSETFRTLVASGMKIAQAAFKAVAAFVTGTFVPALQRVATFAAAELLPRVTAVATFLRANFVPAMQAVGSFITGTLVPAFQRVVSFLVSTFRPTFDALVNFFTNQLVPALVGLGARIKTNLDEFAGFAKVIGVVAVVAAALAAKILGVVLPVLVALAGFLAKTLLAAVGVVIGVLGSLAQAVTTIATTVGAMVNIVRAGFAGLVGLIKGAVNVIVGIFTGDLGRIKTGASQAVSGVVAVMGTVPRLVLAALGGLGNLLVGAGGDLLRGLARGITGAIGGVVSAAVGAAKAAVNAVKGALGINSPSRVFAELGMFSGQGLAQGLAGSKGLVGRAANDLLDVAGMSVGSPAFIQNRLGIEDRAGLGGLGAVVSAVEAQTAEMRRMQDREITLRRTGL